MDTNFKLKRIRELTDEVKQLHPLLRDLLPKLPNVKAVNYTHGPNEMGADFVLEKVNETLLRDEYVGVIAKSDDIKQDYTQLERQIKECGVARKIEGGKKNIFLNETWVITNRSISENAKTKIHHEYQSRNIQFIWDETLVTLIDRFYPEYWENIDKNVALYLSSVSRRLSDFNARQNILDNSIGDIYIEQRLKRIEPESKKKFIVHSKSASLTLSGILKKERFVFVEAGMGYGKSRLLREAAIEYANHRNFAERTVLPVFLNFKDLLDDFGNKLSNVFAHLQNELKADPHKLSLLLVIDSIDEVKGDSQYKSEMITSFVKEVMPFNNIKVVFASRPFEDPLVEDSLDRCLVRYSLQPMSVHSLISFIEGLCSKSIITSKLKNDLQHSDLFKSLPRTPISAILLGKILNTNAKDIPSTLPELYSKYTELALGRWDIRKGNLSEKEYETTVIVVRLLAKQMFENNMPEMGIGDAKVLIEEYLSKRRTGFSTNQIFDCISNCSEIISIDELKNKLFFKHRSFMEFLYSEWLFLELGKNAAIQMPFDVYWQAVNYFYLGKLKDCPSQLSEIFNTLPSSERESIIKLSQAGHYLLAAYQSPYETITDCVRRTILDAVEMYCQICEQPSSSNLSKFSELQLLAIMTGLMRHTFEYDFFSKSIIDVETEILLSVDEDRKKAIAAFFLGSIRAGIGHPNAFEALINDHITHLPTVVKVGIGHASTDAQVTNEAIKKLGKRMNRSIRENQILYRTIYDEPLNERKNYSPM